ncbi:MAG TPA: hypothetical protein VGW38_07000 [Chloroflexota bacterium]|nr:hypothetical protein [Chloroflexota bacterium]
MKLPRAITFRPHRRQCVHMEDGRRCQQEELLSVGGQPYCQVHLEQSLQHRRRLDPARTVEGERS